VTATDPTHRAVDAVWRIESARLIAGLARLVRDVGLAEELAQDALVIALEQWPNTGVPDDPGPWLMATAKHRAIDLLRRRGRYATKLNLLGRDVEIGQEHAEAELEAALDDHIGDDLLRLIFTAAHPVLSTEAKAALTLRLLGGLTTGEIARAFLISETTAAQRIVRAKRTLAAARVQFEMPTPADMADRLSSVLEIIYLIFNEGYSATGARWPTRCVRHDHKLPGHPLPVRSDHRAFSRYYDAPPRRSPRKWGRARELCLSRQHPYETRRLHRGSAARPTWTLKPNCGCEQVRVSDAKVPPPES
jgi:RNA polymerase sigma factor (sigma-70 family)